MASSSCFRIQAVILPILIVGLPLHSCFMRRLPPEKTRPCFSTKPGLQHKHKIKHDKTTIQFPVNANEKCIGMMRLYSHTIHINQVMCSKIKLFYLIKKILSDFFCKKMSKNIIERPFHAVLPANSRQNGAYLRWFLAPSSPKPRWPFSGRPTP